MAAVNPAGAGMTSVGFVRAVVPALPRPAFPSGQRGRAGADDEPIDVPYIVLDERVGASAAQPSRRRGARRRAAAGAVPGAWTFPSGNASTHAHHRAALRAYAPPYEYLGLYVDVWA